MLRNPHTEWSQRVTVCSVDSSGIWSQRIMLDSTVPIGLKGQCLWLSQAAYWLRTASWKWVFPWAWHGWCLGCLRPCSTHIYALVLLLRLVIVNSGEAVRSFSGTLNTCPVKAVWGQMKFSCKCVLEESGWNTQAPYWVLNHIGLAGCPCGQVSE